jgi:hypothetical protein
VVLRCGRSIRGLPANSLASAFDKYLARLKTRILKLRGDSCFNFFSQKEQRCSVHLRDESHGEPLILCRHPSQIIR